MQRNDYTNKEVREPSPWVKEATLKHRDVVCDISCLNGKIYSFSVSKMKRDGTLTRFFQPADIESLYDILDELRDYFDKKLSFGSAP